MEKGAHLLEWVVPGELEAQQKVVLAAYDSTAGSVVT